MRHGCVRLRALPERSRLARPIARDMKSPASGLGSFGLAIEVQVSGFHVLEGELLVVGGFGVVSEDGYASGVGGQLGDGFGHGCRVSDRRGEAAVSVTHYLGHSANICHQRGQTYRHGLKK